MLVVWWIEGGPRFLELPSSSLNGRIDGELRLGLNPRWFESPLSSRREGPT